MRSLALSSLLLVACGGSIGPIDPTTLHIEGSYDFVIGGVTITPSTDPQPLQPSSSHPAIGQHARLDIQKSGSSYVAAVTPDFSDPQSMTVSIASDGTVTLVGSVSFSGGDSGYQTTSDELDTIRLAVGSDGHLAGTFNADGNEYISEGDVGWVNVASVTGNVGADSRAPQSLANMVPYAQTVVLPWDSINVRLSEPVAADALMNAVSLAPSQGGTASVAWTASPSTIDWLGSSSLTGFRRSWSDFSGAATLSVAAGLADPSGNVSASVAAPVQFIDVPSGEAFGGSAPPAMWGAAAIVSSADSCGSAGSCIEIGPITGPCSAQAGGIAGHFTNSGNSISLTYRIRIAAQGSGLPGGLGVSVATPGFAAHALTDPKLEPQINPTNDPNYPFASDWTTATIALPQLASDVGFAVSPFANGQMYCGGGGPAWEPVTIVVDIAAVAAP